LNQEAPNNPVSNFEVLWNEFDAKYGLFQIKNMNWDSVYTIYRPQINEQSSDTELYDVLTKMLGTLNDNHVGLVPTNADFPFYQSGIFGKMDTINDFDLTIIKENYLQELEFEDPFFTYGKLPSNIGYIHIEGFSDLPQYLDKPFETVLSSLKNTKAIIIDVRGGYGGEDLAGQYLAGRFTAETIPYMKTRIKNGSGKTCISKRHGI